MSVYQRWNGAFPEWSTDPFPAAAVWVDPRGGTRTGRRRSLGQQPRQTNRLTFTVLGVKPHL